MKPFSLQIPNQIEVPSTSAGLPPHVQKKAKKLPTIELSSCSNSPRNILIQDNKNVLNVTS